jgi:hypothetical protein
LLQERRLLLEHLQEGFGVGLLEGLEKVFRAGKSPHVRFPQQPRRDLSKRLFERPEDKIPVLVGPNAPPNVAGRKPFGHELPEASPQDFLPHLDPDALRRFARPGIL